jgi:hypothetical protein
MKFHYMMERVSLFGEYCYFFNFFGENIGHKYENKFFREEDWFHGEKVNYNNQLYMKYTLVKILKTLEKRKTF